MHNPTWLCTRIIGALLLPLDFGMDGSGTTSKQPYSSDAISTSNAVHPWPEQKRDIGVNHYGFKVRESIEGSR